jgi:predicted nucleotidyltransferase
MSAQEASSPTFTALGDLPATVQKVLAELVQSAQSCLQDDLRSVVLFGSGAEARLRATSDLNLLFILARFDQPRIDRFREPLRMANVAVRASAMFVLESELPAAAEAFAVKFDDIGRRRRVLYGNDPIAALSVSRDSKKVRLKQILLNLTLRLRNQYATTGLREEHLAPLIADMAGPLRSAAATLLELEGRSATSPRQALEAIAAELQGSDWPEILRQVSEARETGRLPPGAAGPVLFRLMALADEMRRRAERGA